MLQLTWTVLCINCLWKYLSVLMIRLTRLFEKSDHIRNMDYIETWITYKHANKQNEKIFPYVKH